MADNKQGASQASQMNELPRLRRLADDKTHTLSELNIIGRHVDCDLLIDDEKGVSRKHARLTVADGVVYVEDLGSLNGTLVNGDESEGKQALANGDILIFDEQEYELFVPYEANDDFDPAMTIIADRSAIKKRIEKMRGKKKQLIADTPQPADPPALPPVENTPFTGTPTGEVDEMDEQQPMLSPGTVDAGSLDRKAANHTMIDLPRKASTPSMRIVDEDFLREVQGDADSTVEGPDGIEAAQEAADELDEASLEQQTPSQMSAIREAFDVSDEEVEEILHDDMPGGSPTRFIPDERHDTVDGTHPGSAPFLTLNEPMQRASVEAAAFTKGTAGSTPAAHAQPGSVSDIVHAQLIILDDGKHYRLPLSGDRTSWTIGSAADADIRIAQRQVAADHAIILKEGLAWTLCDRGTEGGCAVNGQEVNVARIQLGDRLHIGSAECLFTAPENEVKPSPVREQARPAGKDPFGEDPMDSPRLRVEIPLDDSIWDEHEQQLYRDTSRDRILRERTSSSRHESEKSAAPAPRRPSRSTAAELPADYGRPRGLQRFLPSSRTLMAVALGVIALAILGTLAYLVL